jgi:hypothetical protein
MTEDEKKKIKKGALSLFGNIPFIFDDLEGNSEKARRIGEEHAKRYFSNSLKKAQELAPKQQESIRGKNTDDDIN